MARKGRSDEDILKVLRGEADRGRRPRQPPNEFIAGQLHEWLIKVGVTPLQIYPGSPLG